MKTIKKAQKGVKQKPKPITGPTFVNFRMAKEKTGTESPATRKDSLDYKRGWLRGLKGDKPSAMEKKWDPENEYEKMGRWEGQNKGKKNAVKKGKNGTKLKKQAATAIAMKKAGKSPKKAMMGAMAKPMMKSGGSMKKCRYGCK